VLAASATLLLLAVAPSRAAGQACLPPGDLAVVDEARARIDRYGAVAWPGWREAPPMLLRGDGEDCLIGHPAPPEGFVAGEDGIHRRPGHLVPAPAATAWPVAERWSVAVPLRTELQALVDQHVGPGVIELDDEAYLRTLVHEAFHAHQMTVIGGPQAVPGMGGGDGDGPGLEALEAVPGRDAAIDAQGAALRDALTAATHGEALAAVDRFLEARAAWREDAPAGTDAVERQLEWLEGTPRYADVLMALLPASPTAGTGPAAAWTDLMEQLAAPSAIASGPRDRYAALGAGEAFVLDRLRPGWKARALPGGTPLEDLLREARSSRAGVPASLAEAELRTVRLNGAAWRVAVADGPDGWTRGLAGVASLGTLDGMLFAFPEDVRAPFWMRGATMPLDVAFFAEGGELLGAFTMPLCAADPCPTYRPDAPYRYALEAPMGRLAPLRAADDPTLELR
jgi:uncharacterized membrane protein (UPF0127 family)